MKIKNKLGNLLAKSGAVRNRTYWVWRKLEITEIKN